MNDHRHRDRYRNARARFALGALGLAALAACGDPARDAAQQGRAASSLDGLVSAAAERLQTAEPVAEFKWINHADVEDPARAEQVVTSAAEMATARNIDPEFVKQAFRNQIAATEGVQYALFAEWKLGTRDAPRSAPDLSESRAAIDVLNKQMVDEMAAQWRVLHSPSCATELRTAIENAVTADKLDELDRDALTAATRSYCS